MIENCIMVRMARMADTSTAKQDLSCEVECYRTDVTYNFVFLRLSVKSNYTTFQFTLKLLRAKIIRSFNQVIIQP